MNTDQAILNVCATNGQNKLFRSSPPEQSCSVSSHVDIRATESPPPANVSDDCRLCLRHLESVQGDVFFTSRRPGCEEAAAEFSRQVDGNFQSGALSHGRDLGSTAAASGRRPEADQEEAEGVPGPVGTAGTQEDEDGPDGDVRTMKKMNKTKSSSKQSPLSVPVI